MSWLFVYSYLLCGFRVIWHISSNCVLHTLWFDYFFFVCICILFSLNAETLASSISNSSSESLASSRNGHQQKPVRHHHHDDVDDVDDDDDDEREEGEESSSSSNNSEDETPQQQQQQQQMCVNRKSSSDGEDDEAPVSNNNKEAEEGELDSADDGDDSHPPPPPPAPAPSSQPAAAAAAATLTSLNFTQESERLLGVHKRLKTEQRDVEHKLSKIERALLKALADASQANIKKCRRYKVKYEAKLASVKASMRDAKHKLAELTVTATKRKQQQQQQQQQQPPATLKEEEDAIDLEASGKVKRHRGDEQQPTPTVSLALSIQQDQSTSDVKQPQPQQQQQQQQLKLPYPVLNDKRDMQTILSTLETKRREFMGKRDANRRNMDKVHEAMVSAVQSGKPMTAAAEARQRADIDKMRQVAEAYEAQLDKLAKQIEYVKLTLSLDALRNGQQQQQQQQQQQRYESPLMTRMLQQLNSMYMYMKSENAEFMRRQQQQQAKDEEKMAREAAEAAAVARAKEAEKREAEKAERLKASVEKLTTDMSAVLAHTAARAHLAAAVQLYNYSYYSYYQQQQQQQQLQQQALEKQQKQQQQQQKKGKKGGSKSSSKSSAVDETALMTKTMPMQEMQPAMMMMPMLPALPSSDELAKASTTFAKYKNKISSFFQQSLDKMHKQEQQEAAHEHRKKSKKKKEEASGLLGRKLVANYDDEMDTRNTSDDSDDDDNGRDNDETRIAKLLQTLKGGGGGGGVQQEQPQQKKTGDEDDEDDDEDDDECDLEIVMTSERNAQRNYILPSLKAVYFPLKASLAQSDRQQQQQQHQPIAATSMSTTPNGARIAIEKSSKALTFLGIAASPNSMLARHATGPHVRPVKLANILYARPTWIASLFLFVLMFQMKLHCLLTIFLLLLLLSYFLFGQNKHIRTHAAMMLFYLVVLYFCWSEMYIFFLNYIRDVTCETLLIVMMICFLFVLSLYLLYI